MKAYLICPQEQEVKEVEYDGNWETIAKWIDCQIIDAVRIHENGDSIFVDDEGMLISQPPDNFFIWNDYEQPLAGKGLVLGCDARGNSVAPKCSIEYVRANITWAVIMKSED